MTVRQAIRAALRLLTRHDRRHLYLSVVAQMSTAILDLIGVTLMGLIGALAVAGIEGREPPRRVASAISSIGLGELPQPALVALVAGAAGAAMLLKSIISPLLMMRVFRFLAGREVAVSASLARQLLSRPLTFVQLRSTQETAAAVVGAATAATTILLGQAVVAIAELALLAMIAVALLLINPALAIGVIVYFGVVAYGLQRILGPRAALYGRERVTADIACLGCIQEALGTYREITVSDRQAFFVDRTVQLRHHAAQASAKQQFVTLLPKYIGEAALVLGAFALAAWLFSTEEIGVAAGTFALFLAAVSRLMPSLLRLQAATLAIRGAAGSGARTFALADDLGQFDVAANSGHEAYTAPDPSYPGFAAGVELEDVCFGYPGANAPAIRGISLSIKVGQSVALVGRSGAGKSTLADLILGVLSPDRGTVSVSGMAPMAAIKRWPGGIAYVPQDVMMIDDSVRNNVALGVPPDQIDDALVWDALGRAHLANFIADQPGGLDTRVGERGLRLSGGQRQRLGIARALFSRPQLLVLDEATSSLDAETERVITDMLDDFGEGITTVIVAHRLSTVRHADLVVYLENGEEVAAGTFAAVCERVPALQRQSELMGLR